MTKEEIENLVRKIVSKELHYHWIIWHKCIKGTSKVYE